MDKSPLMANVLDVVRLGAVGLEKAAALEAKVEKDRQKVASLIPQVVTALRQADLIRESEKQAMAEHLADPANALNTIFELCREHVKQAERLAAGSKPLGTLDDGSELRRRGGQQKQANATWLGKRKDTVGAAEQAFYDAIMNFNA